MNRLPMLNLTGIALLLALIVLPGRVRAEAETNSAAMVSAAPETESDTMATLRAYLQLQGQLHQAQQAIERTRQDALEAAAKHELVMRNTDALAQQLKDVEDRLTDQRARETRLTIIAVSAFAGICFVAVIVTSFFQWRVVNRLVQWPAALPGSRSFEPPVSVAALGTGSDPLVSSVQIEQPNLRLLGAIERLEKRIQELEEAARVPLPGPAAGSNGERTNGHAPSATALDDDARFQERSNRLKELLDRAHTLLNEEKPEAAIGALDEALQLEPDNSEALVRKGAALEKLRRLSEAIECYDRAIAADGSMTIAYLYKGGLFNRMERFTEAVECYEKALRTQEKAV